jgi:hypothetical protein
LRVCVAFLSSVVAVGLLAACGIKVLPVDELTGPFAIQRAGQTLSIAVCKEVDIGDIRASIRNVGDGEDWSRFFHATWAGDRPIKAGAVLNLEELPDSARVEISRYPSISSGSEIAIFLTGTDAEIALLFSVEGEGLPDVMWLHPDGSQTAEPCQNEPVGK